MVLRNARHSSDAFLRREWQQFVEYSGNLKSSLPDFICERLYDCENCATNEVKIFLFEILSSSQRVVQRDARWFATRLITENNLKKRESVEAGGGIRELEIKNCNSPHSDEKIFFNFLLYRRFIRVQKRHSSKEEEEEKCERNADGKNSRQSWDAFDINFCNLSNAFCVHYLQCSLSALYSWRGDDETTR